MSTTEMPLDMIQALTRRIADLEAERTGWVTAARLTGLTWQQIADQLGVTKQAAQQRYGR